MLADGEIAHYPMLTFAVPGVATLNEAAAQDLGFFAQPGDDAATNGLTLWEPAGARRHLSCCSISEGSSGCPCTLP